MFRVRFRLSSREIWFWALKRPGEATTSVPSNQPSCTAHELGINESELNLGDGKQERCDGSREYYNILLFSLVESDGGGEVHIALTVATATTTARGEKKSAGLIRNSGCEGI